MMTEQGVPGPCAVGADVRPPPSGGPSFCWEAPLPAMKREMVAAYRSARARARRSTTPRLHHDEARAREAVAASAAEDGLDEVEFARLTALRDELQARGEAIPHLAALSMARGVADR